MEKVTIILLVMIITPNLLNGFLMDDTGCVMYGQCGRGFNNGHLNCPANASVQNEAPLVTDPEALQILRDYCPRVYAGDTNTRACCSIQQLRTFKSSISLPAALISKCPACYLNFLNQICQVTCSPLQKTFMWADPSFPKPSHYTNGLPGVTVLMSNTYGQAMLDSCKDVHGFLGLQAISLLCGRSADTCTPDSWLNFMGSTANGQAPFPIKYIMSDVDQIMSDNSTRLSPVRSEAARCNERLSTSSSVIGTSACNCKDCERIKCNPPTPTAATRQQFFDNMFGAGKYKIAELIIGRTNGTTIVHTQPPPSVDTINFSSIFDKVFLEQVLQLQENISALTTTGHNQGAHLGLTDVCARVAGQAACVVESVTQYYQNDKANMEKRAWDEYHFFILADYLDHFLYCANNPMDMTDATKLNMSCQSLFGQASQPEIILQGYKGLNYNDANSLVVTFVLNATAPGVDDWLNRFVRYMKHLPSTDMTITFTPSTETHGPADSTLTTKDVGDVETPLFGDQPLTEDAPTNNNVQPKTTTTTADPPTDNDDQTTMAAESGATPTTTAPAHLPEPTKGSLPKPRPSAWSRQAYYDSTFGKDNYITAEVVIERADKGMPIVHTLPSTPGQTVKFTPIFEKAFLKQVLKLQTDLSGLTAEPSIGEQRTVSLDDGCASFPGQQGCVVESLLQYYQNKEAELDAGNLDSYLDHFLTCSSGSSITMDTVTKKSCVSTFGNVTLPYIVLGGYDADNYMNATSLLLTFVLQDTADGHLWREAFVSYMSNYHNSNMSLTYTPSTHAGYEFTTEPLQGDQGHCVWYGQCGSGWNNGRLNCAAKNGTTMNSPLLKDPEGLKILQKYCPNLYNGVNNTRTCCNVDQLKTFESNLALPDQLLARCPACYHNFLNEICQMTCSPTHSNFLVGNHTAKCPDSSAPKGGVCSQGGLPSVTYVVTDKYASDLYTSCKDVMMPATNDKAMSVFCGRKAEKCNPHIWLEYMGSTGNGRAPFPILYHYTDTPWHAQNETYTPMNMSNVRCNETYSNTSEACSCQDCHMSCAPVPPPPPPKKPWTILGIDGVSFIVGIIFAVFVIFFGVYVICYNIMVKDSLGMDSKGDSKYNFENPELDSTSGSQHNLIRQSMVSPADIGSLEKLGARVEEILRSVFTWWGTLCAKNPIVVLLVTIIIFGSLAGGIARYQVTTDPVRLWSAPTSTARVQKDYFDQHFGPFYRTEQIIISQPGNNTVVTHDFPPPSVNKINFTSLFDKGFMHKILDLQTQVEQITATYNGENVTLRDICFKPLEPDNNECTIESPFQYWRNNRTQFDKVAWDEYHFFVMGDYLDHFLQCVQSPASVSDQTKLNMSCLGTYGGPAYPWVVMGGYDGNNYNHARAFVITFVVNNHVDEKLNGKAEAWEAEFIKFMKKYEVSGMNVSFSSQRSIQDELDRESRSDVFTIVLSYLIMFGYITIALGQFRRCDTILIDSKITLGLSGVTIVLLSVASSVGLYSYCRVPMTLIIIEVVPFLVLAVGVDNIFILVQTFQRDQRRPSETLEEQIGRVLGTVGPSMLLTSFSESIAFFIGAWTDMPAVREFALYAAMAVLFDFILQITCFISLMTIDAKRQQGNRFDILCCVRLPKNEKQEEECETGCLYKLVNEYYSHALLSSWVRPIVIVLFVGWFMASIAFACHLTIGLDQALSMPKDSYVLDYFNNISAYLSVGAPVYFVVPAGLNYTSLRGQNALCGGKGCPQDSLIGQVFQASQLPNYTMIAQPASSWIDDYFSWLNAEGNPPCCRIHNKTGAFCPSTVNSTDCMACPFDPQVAGRPSSRDFMKYLPMFLSDNPGLVCAKGGHAAYGAGVNLIKNKTQVGATYFMTYHTPMNTSEQYINGLKEARSIAANISRAMNVSGDQAVFPYSVFYVFYEQYLTIVHNTLKNIGTCMAAIFIATFILLGFDLVSAFVVCLTIIMIIIDIMGMMYLWDINLNALSLVNLVMAIGISVEFCSHIARAFAVSIEPNKVLRAKDALAHMGSSVLSGITLTKLGGIIVLAFAKSQLFQVFYFRMYLGMVVFGASHGLIFLPVLLSYIGPSINKAKLYQYQQNCLKTMKKSQSAHNGIDNEGMYDTIPESSEYQPPRYSERL